MVYPGLSRVADTVTKMIRFLQRTCRRARGERRETR